MRYHYRCSTDTCRKRVTLNKPIGMYVQRKYRVCPSCKGHTLKECPSVNKWNKANTCRCDGYHFPHMKGSKWCFKNTKPLTDEDYEDRHRSIPANL